MPLNSIPVTTNAPALKAKVEAAEGKCFVDVGFWGGVVPGNTEELAPMSAAGVAGFKCFLVPSGVAEFPHVTEADLRATLPELARLGAAIQRHSSSTSTTPSTSTSQPSDGVAPNLNITVNPRNGFKPSLAVGDEQVAARIQGQILRLAELRERPRDRGRRRRPCGDDLAGSPTGARLREAGATSRLAAARLIVDPEARTFVGSVTAVLSIGRDRRLFFLGAERRRSEE